jgi:hypothetical protein
VYIDYNYWTYAAILITIVGVVGAIVCFCSILALDTYPAIDSERAAQERREKGLFILGTLIGVAFAAVGILSGVSSSNDNALKLQAAVKHTYGLNITLDDAHQLNTPLFGGYPDIILKRVHHPTTNTDTITKQTVYLEQGENGRLKLLNYGAPFNERETASTEYKRIDR